jgi:hypothetical protein
MKGFKPFPLDLSTQAVDNQFLARERQKLF